MSEFDKWFEAFHVQIRKSGFSKSMAKHYASNAWVFQQKEMDQLNNIIREMINITERLSDYDLHNDYGFAVIEHMRLYAREILSSELIKKYNNRT